MIIGGPSLHVSLLTKHMPKEYETKLIVGAPDKGEKKADYLLAKMGIEPIEVPDMSRDISLVDDIIAYRKIKAIIQQERPDIVHTHASKPGAIGRWAAYRCGVPIIVHTYHGHVFHSYFSAIKSQVYVEIERRLAKMSTKIIAISNLQKAELSETFKIAPAEKIEVIPLGLNLEPFREQANEKRLAFRQEYGLTEDTIAIGIVGRLAPIKNHPLFISAIKYLLQQTDKRIKAFIVGDGECRASLTGLCEEQQIGYSTPEKPDYSQPIIFTSWRTDIDVVNAGLDIITLTSLNEGTPVSIIEAQASSKPIVATVCGGIEDVVIAGETALLAEQGDHIGFYKQLHRVVEDNELRQSMSRQGEAFAFKRFSYQRLVEDMDGLYKRLLHEVGR